MGALLENLNDLDSDILFIKNIDNIVVFEKNKEVSEYKKMLAGVLVEVQERAFKFLEELDEDEVSEADLLAIAMYVSKKMNVSLVDDFDDFASEEKKNYLKSKLNRPIRVCGMVKNEGEPGGGPFWVKDYNGEVSLQIVEFAQIDIANEGQAKIVENATHFNPTDLVCGVKDYKGEKFDLLDFVDPEAAFITMKTQNGTDIQALELPGLWNGSMADWVTIFVEVPLRTFSPVKTVNDLLKPEHQGG
ncbi:ribosylnicotinamide kinase homolog [Algibacter lectus]|uniref:Ribosylnicotinamide kinase homolog n=1 Tax=Algibacter lectus TaxID=221126 RepID=A0A090X5K7_9FLAO|nr:ribosylnicotinamide kinase homolog [Algibacter lectus]